MTFLTECFALITPVVLRMRNGSLVPMEIGETLAMLRQRQHISVRQLAAGARVSPSTVSRIETGKLDPTVGTMTALLDALGVHMTIDGTPVMARSTSDSVTTAASIRPLPQRSRDALAHALHYRSLAGLAGQDRARTAARIRRLRASPDPAELLRGWWDGADLDDVNFGTNLVAHAREGDDRYVANALRKTRYEYLRSGSDLADVIASERTIKGLDQRALATAAGVELSAVRSLESNKPILSPGPVRRILKALDVTPTALPDLQALT